MAKCTGVWTCMCKKHRRNRELLGDTVAATMAVTGALTDPAPSTDQLDDAQRNGHSYYENAPEEASREQGNSTSQG